MLLDLGGEARQAHDLGHAGPGEAFSAGALGPAGNLVGLQESLPLDGLAQEFDDSGCVGALWRCWRGSTLRDGAHDPVGEHAARQGADVAIFEGPFGPEGDLDRFNTWGASSPGPSMRSSRNAVRRSVTGRTQRRCWTRMKKPSFKYVGDQSVRALLTRYACPLPFHAVRTRFLGNIATPKLNASPVQTIKSLWGGELPEFDDMVAVNELFEVLMNLWNALAKHQSGTTPYRLARMAATADPGRSSALVPHAHGGTRRLH